MDFSEHHFKEEVSFAAMLLVEADFSEAKFDGMAHFEYASFLDIAGFGDAIFGNFALFSLASFNHIADFGGASFGAKVRFGKASFDGMAHFARSSFDDHADFRKAKFGEITRFDHASFNEAVRFERASFGGWTLFNGAEFSKDADFSGANFGARSDFSEATFLAAPKFFEARLHEDTDFTGIDWSATENSYMRPWLMRPYQKEARENASDAKRTWERLALLMGQMGRWHDRHEFFRLRMRAERSASCAGMEAMANYFFDQMADYGWSVGRTSFMWLFHIILFGMVIFSVSPDGHTCGSFPAALFDSLLVSLANAHAFLGLTRLGGYLHESSSCLMRAEDGIELLNALGTAQAFIGPVMLFLVLLAFRNRFRVG